MLKFFLMNVLTYDQLIFSWCGGTVDAYIMCFNWSLTFLYFETDSCMTRLSHMLCIEIYVPVMYYLMKSLEHI